MSLFIRLFLVIGGLLALLLLGQAWWVRNLTAELSEAAEVLAFDVANHTASVLVDSEHRVDCTDTDTETGTSIKTATECAEHLAHRTLSSEQLAERVVELLPVQMGSRRVEVVESASGRAKIRRWVHVDGRLEELLASDEEDVLHSLDSAKTSEDSADAIHPVQARALPPGKSKVLAHLEDTLKRLSEEHEVDSEEHVTFQVKLQGRSEPGGQIDEDVMAWKQSGVLSSTQLIFHPASEGQEAAIYVAAASEPTRLHRIAVPQSGLEGRVEDFSRRLMLGSVGTLGLGLMLAALVAHRFSRPLRELARAAAQVGEGKLGTQIVTQTGGEVGQAISAFNRMSKQVRQLDDRNRVLSNRQHLEEIGEIARALAHTLRNPLNALGLSVEELASQGPEEAADLADAARRQIRRIDRSLRSFLALASGGAGVAAEVDLAELARDVALEALQDCRGRVHVEVEADPSLEPLLAVAPEIRAVLQALIVNAVEASPDGARVHTRLASREGREVEVSIEDHGPGLAPEIRSRLFTPHLSTKAQGSGMGLFLAQRIACNRYGGSLELQDLSPQGTRAVLRLGARRGDSQDSTRKAHEGQREETP